MSTQEVFALSNFDLVPGKYEGGSQCLMFAFFTYACTVVTYSGFLLQVASKCGKVR